ncbi:hypothetical protein SDC9_186980 [bioreactor metagenome]|uniref:Uncharacterized protein n=1 Tax=bioreactor metagenome TaxID=1076179 RepID=A0A645HLY2_9ZZZZ
MPRLRFMPAQTPQGSFVDILIEKSIKIHQVTLVSVAAPRPAVSFDPVDVYFPGA